ncbi:hypothetical protein [Corallococcus macrosporus]|uniref:Uncharacterized protein n=1 Tax=Corallococcus macrosporus DSM 14697 TaxID=1189310 RepID=A0A250JM09_9BACT|nr:hypothetical protein [Corallococcus macrosporus]ATB44688.1 hypothetical protein MYMAC_000259 [Corallococcus macrosporus DSM 14697]
MPNALLVPLHLDALCLTSDTNVREALADYERQPFVYKDDSGEAHFFPLSDSRPNLSTSILSPPLSGSLLRLPAGIHLHWALPDALTHSREDDDAGQRHFPPVPNRWLVTRRRGGQVERQWVVESDYLYPDLSILQDAKPLAVTVPFPATHPFTGPYQPFRHLGRQVPAEQWSPSDASAEYLGQFQLALTATGASEWVRTLDPVQSTFAAFYPNCFSVFGFRDTDPAAWNNPRGLEYEVTGWYADPAQDCLAILCGQSPADAQQRLAALQDDFAWTVTLGANDFPQRTLCYSRLTFRDAAQTNPAASANQVALALGHTGTQALAAYLADQLAPDANSKPLFEEQLASFQYREQLQQHTVDVHAKLREVRHAEGFTARGGGLLWTVRQRSPTSQPPQEQATLPDALAHQLNLINEQQDAYQRARDAIASMSSRLFNDWSIWMHCRHPEGLQEDEPIHVDIDDASSAVIDSALTPLRTAITLAGVLQWQRDTATGQVRGVPLEVGLSIISTSNEWYDDYKRALEQSRLKASDWKSEFTNCGLTLSDSVRVQQPQQTAGGSDEGKEWRIIDGSVTYRVKVEDGVMNLYIPPLATQLATQLATAINALRDAVQAVSTDFELGVTPQPRYWQPNDPVVLMMGDTVRPTLRHGQDGRNHEDGQLECQLLTDIEDAALQDLPRRSDLQQRVRAILDGITPAQGEDRVGFTDWTRQPWNPFMLEWDVEFFPLAAKDQRFEPDTLTRRYTLARDAVDLALDAGHEDDFTQGARPYRGFSLLSGHAGTQLQRWIAGYLVEQASQLPPPLDSGLRGLTVEQACDALDTQDLGAVLGRYTPTQAQDPIVTALKSYARLKDMPCLSQTLSGFNDALVMHQRVMQLPITDPNGDSDSDQLATQVAGTVRDALLQSSAPDADFTPIRGGELRLSGLHLVDTFGQYNDLETRPDQGSTLCSTELMPLRRYTATDWRVRLEPRLAQPARLAFRWLSATPVDGRDDLEMNSHPATSPLCGWVLPNNLDSSLMVYDASGTLLGLVDEEGRWESAPGSEYPLDVGSLPNPHLQQLVSHLTRGAGAEGRDFIRAFLDTLNDAIERSDPEDFSQHQALALLIGRPLALVRASVGLELQGLPERDKSWSTFAATVAELAHNERQGIEAVTPITDSPDRWTQAFDQVAFPVRIGEYGQYNDGVAGYWRELEGGGYESATFYAPQSDLEGFSGKDAASRRIVTARDTPVNLELSPRSGPRTLVMLVDPRGKTHATSGIFPTKALSIPPDQYAAALQAISVTFLSAPLVTPRAEYDNSHAPPQLRIPLPQEAGYAWSWLSRREGAWSETTGFAPVEASARLSGAQVLCEGWLKLTPTKP